jgi:hypothetical protein
MGEPAIPEFADMSIELMAGLDDRQWASPSQNLQHRRHARGDPCTLLDASPPCL